MHLCMRVIDLCQLNGESLCNSISVRLKNIVYALYESAHELFKIKRFKQLL